MPIKARSFAHGDDARISFVQSQVVREKDGSAGSSCQSPHISSRLEHLILVLLPY